MNFLHSIYSIKIMPIKLLTLGLCLFSVPLQAETIDVKSVYALAGNGQTDDIGALQTAVNQNVGKTLLLKDGVFRISDTLSLPAGTHLQGVNAVIHFAPTASNPESLPLAVNSNSHIANLTIDGNLQANYGIWINGNSQAVTVENVEIHDLVSVSPNDASGIVQGLRVSAGASDILLDGLHVHHLYARENGVQGDSYGSVRALYVGEAYNVVIKNCNLHDIQGYEDGDAIQVQANLQHDLNVTVKNCSIRNFGKRALKIQASGVTVTQNRIENDNLDFLEPNSIPPFAQVGNNQLLPGVAEGIAVMGNDNVISFNTIVVNSASWPISLQGTGLMVEGNYAVINGTPDLAYGTPVVRTSFIRALYVYQTYDSSIINNTFASPFQGIHLRDSSDIQLENNIIGVDGMRPLYWQEGTTTNNSFVNNTRLIGSN